MPKAGVAGSHTSMGVYVGLGEGREMQKIQEEFEKATGLTVVNVTDTNKPPRHAGAKNESTATTSKC